MATTLQRIGIFQKLFQSYRERPPSEHKYRFHFFEYVIGNGSSDDPFWLKFEVIYVHFAPTFPTKK